MTDIARCDFCHNPAEQLKEGGCEINGKELKGMFCSKDCFDKWVLWKSCFLKWVEK